MRIIFFGTPQFVTPILDSLHQNFEVVGVITNPDQKVGRKQVLTPSSVKIAAQKYQIAVFTPEKFDDKLTQQIKKLEPDLIVTAAYGKIIPKSVLDLPKYGALNIHPSLLPLYRGATPIQSAILNGDQTTGITIYKMDAKMDHGSIVFQKDFSLTNQDNNEVLSNKLFLEAAEIIVQVVSDFVSGKINPQPQDESKATFCKTLTKQSGYFDLLQPPTSEQLDRMIRAYFPWPTAWTTWNPPSCHPERSSEGSKIIKFYPDGKIQMEGKNPVKLDDFLRGYPTFPLKDLGSN